MKEEYVIFSKQVFGQFPFQQTETSAKPDLLLEMTFSPKLFIRKEIANQLELSVIEGVEWLDARVDCSPSQPAEDEIEVLDNYRMPYLHQTYALTNQEKRYGKLNWIDANSTDFDFSKLETIPLEERLIFKLEEDFGLVFIHQSVIDVLKQQVKEVWVRGMKL